MKTTKLMSWAFIAVVFAAFSLVGCEGLETYQIDAPSDLQSRIDSIADANESVDRGDTTYITIGKTIVGAEDASSAWWTEFSDYFAVPANKLLHLEFVNHSSGVNNWNNWNLAITNDVGDRDAEGYAEYFVLRSDAFGWGGTMVNEDESYAFDLSLVAHNYPDTDGDGDIWNDFRTTMQGANVTLEIDHSATGNVFVTAKALGTNGTELEMTYTQPVSAANDITAFLICDGSYFEMKNAYLIPSKVTEVEDVVPVSLTIEGTPAFVELGDDDFWGDAVATVMYADGSSEVVDTADLSFNVIPDMSTLGEKDVIVAYNKTKQGEYTDVIVTTQYSFEITNSVASIEITTLPEITEYYFYDDTLGIFFDATGMIVTATYSDGSTAVLENESLQIDAIQAVEGAQNVNVSFVGATSTVSTTCPVNLVKGLYQVGSSDLTTGFWGAHSNEYNVASGDSVTITMYNYSTELNNWNSPVTILRKADLTEYAVVRMDAFGWGDGYGTAVGSNDWDFEAMASNLNGAKVVITVKNNGDNTANVHYQVTYANGETHFQKYEGVTVDSADLNCALTVDGCYLVITE